MNRISMFVNKVKSKVCRDRGSITVEATLVVPVVILSLVAIYFICFLMYQQANAQALADRAAQRGAATWNSAYKDMFIGKIAIDDLKKSDPYWRFLEGQSSKEKKSNRVVNYIKSQLDKYSVATEKGKSGTLEITGTDVSASVESDYIIYKKLKVTIEQSYHIPAGKVLKMVGMSDVYTIKATSEAVINEPAEFIRNTDFLIDTGKEIDRRIAGGKATSFIGELKGGLSKFLDKLDTFIKQ